MRACTRLDNCVAELVHQILNKTIRGLQEQNMKCFLEP